MLPRLVDHPALAPSNGPTVVWGVAPGFAGNPHVLFTLSRDPAVRHPRSAFASVMEDQLTTVIPPPMMAWADYAPEFLEHLAACTDAAILMGLSHGGAFMSRVYRAWRDLPAATRRPRHLGLILWSVPCTPGDLRPLAWLSLKAACALPAKAVSSRLVQTLFIRQPERIDTGRDPELGPDVLELWKDSVKASAAWWHQALLDLVRSTGLGPPIDPEGSVVALNVPGRSDDAVNVSRVLAAIRRSYPGVPNFEVALATRHAIPEHDGRIYAPVLADIRSYFIRNWGLPK